MSLCFHGNLFLFVVLRYTSSTRLSHDRGAVDGGEAMGLGLGTRTREAGIAAGAEKLGINSAVNSLRYCRVS